MPKTKAELIEWLKDVPDDAPIRVADREMDIDYVFEFEYRSGWINILWG
jgi:hypothetical protein